jgi:hypothetical protein
LGDHRDGLIKTAQERTAEVAQALIEVPGVTEV